MMGAKSFPSYVERRRLALLAVVFFSFCAVYATWSIAQFDVLSAGALVKTNVVMRVIQHGVRSVCPRCGFKGAPMCPQCSVDMYWNGYQGAFICSSCGKSGFPECGKCGTPMTWIELK